MAGAAARPTIGIRGVAYDVGERRPIDELPQLRDDAEALARFKARGFGHYTRNPLGIAQQAVASARATLRLAGRSAGDIDALVLGVVELRWYQGVQEELAGEVARGLGFDNIHVVGVNLGGCTNLTGLLRLARSLMLSEGYRNVLVIESNKCAEDGHDRLVPPDVSIFSDGAVSLVLTRDEPEFALSSLVQVTMPVATHEVGPGALLAHRLAATRFVFDRALREAGARRADIRQFFMPNHGTQMLELYADRMKVPRARIHTANLFWLAHAWSADTLINLHAYGHYNDIAAGDRFMVISWGEYNFTALVLQALADRPAKAPPPGAAPRESAPARPAAKA